MSGVFVAVVGPSGAGKDSLIAHARKCLRDDRRVVFVRRTVTRPADRRVEDHDSLDDAAFAEAAAAGRFALSWRAHGLSYGLPASLDADLASGRVVVANLSRTVLPALRARYERTVIAMVTASAEVIAQRLAARGRESADSIRQRLARTVEAPPDAGAVLFDNSGALEVAGDRFVALLGTLAAEPR